MDQAAKERAFKACEFGDSPFFQQAVSESGGERVKDLIAARNDDGRSLIHVAAAGGRKEILSTLLESVRSSGMNSASAVATSDDEGWTPLLSASSCGHAECVTALLEAGAPVDAANSGGRTALHYAASKGHNAIAEILVSAGASLSAKDKLGFSPLHRGAGAGKLGVCQALLDRGARVDATDNGGQTPLMLATQSAHEEVARMLVSRGASVEAADKDGETALSLCSSRELRDTLKRLSEGLGLPASMDLDH